MPTPTDLAAWIILRPQSQRAQPRVHYPVEVRLHAPATRETVRGRLLNLSPSGVFVEVSASLAVGTPVLCELPLGDGVRNLKGHVARSQPLPLSPAGLGIGVKFSDLDEADQMLLAEMVRQSGQRSRLVRVRFDGMRESVPSQAVMTKEGIRLSTALPFVRLASEVGVSFISGTSRVESKGHVRDVQMESRHPDGIPRLAVDVELSARVEETASATAVAMTAVLVQQRPEARSDEAQRAREPRRALRAVPATESGESATRNRPAPRRRLKVRGRRATTFLPSAPVEPPGMVDMGGVAQPPPAGPAPTPTLTPTPGPPPPLASPPPELRPSRALPLLVCLVLGLSVAAVVVWLLPRRAEQDVRPESAVTPVPLTSSAAAPPGGTPAPAAAPAAAAPRPSASAMPAPAARESASPETTRSTPRLLVPRPLPAGTPGPELTVDGDRATVVVPVEGSTGGMIHYSIARPRGLVVNLPHARPGLPVGVHAVRRDGFRFVWVRELPEGGLQVRFTFTRPTPDERVLDVEDQAIKVRVALPTPTRQAHR